MIINDARCHTLFSDFKYPIVVMDIKEIVAIEDIEYRKVLLNTYVGSLGFSACLDSNGNPRINILADILSAITEEEIRAVTYHEQGHIVLGHAGKEDPTSGIEAEEIEADNYASQFLPKHLIASAIDKMASAMLKLIKETELHTIAKLSIEQIDAQIEHHLEAHYRSARYQNLIAE